MANRARYGVIGVLLIAGCGSQRHDDDAPAVAISLTPPSVVLPPGGTQRFAAVVTGASDASVVWSLDEGPEAGEIALDGTYTAARVAGTFHVMARALADARKTASATVNVSLVPAPTLSVEPSAVDIEPGAMLQLRAIVSGSNDRGVLWSIREGSVGGAVDANGLYIAPATTGLYHVVAASHADASRTASAAISVSAKQAVTVSIDPPAATPHHPWSVPAHHGDRVIRASPLVDLHHRDGRRPSAFDRTAHRRPGLERDRGPSRGTRIRDDRSPPDRGRVLQADR